MSEFSESYHLRAQDLDEGVALLERAGIAGWVFPPVGGWCTVVPERDFGGVPDEAVIAANAGLLLFYVNAEDHGWGFWLFDGPHLVSSYSIGWTDEVEADDSALDLGLLRDRLGAAVGPRWDEVERALSTPSAPDEIFGDGNPGHRFAAAVGLSNYEWISGHYLDTDEADHPGLVRVEGGRPPALDIAALVNMTLEANLDLRGAPDAAPVLEEIGQRFPNLTTVRVADMARVDQIPDGMHPKEPGNLSACMTVVFAPLEFVGETVHVTWDDGHRVLQDFDLRFFDDERGNAKTFMTPALHYRDRGDFRFSIAWPDPLAAPRIGIHTGFSKPHWWAVAADFR